MYDGVMERKIKISIGEYYHIYNRGVEKRNIFQDINDQERFIKLLRLTNGQKSLVFRSVQGLPLDTIDVGDRLVAVIAYALMPNHFHLLVREIVDGGISIYMEKLLTAYAMYFNKKHSRVGPLFQGTYKAEHVDHDEYLKYLFAYIHLNPIKLIQPHWKEEGIRHEKKVRQYLNAYRFSSYPDYVGVQRSENIILTKHEAPHYFSHKYTFEEFVHDWLNYQG